ncbi:MAG TPA: hypothetical protein VK358_11650 [Longimicrobium sp.]|nr:hypothetical protein [Longimicrobium sp.]
MRRALWVALGALGVLLLGRERVLVIVGWFAADRVGPRRARNIAAADEHLRADRAAGRAPWTPPSMWRRG